MKIANREVLARGMLASMYRDSYFPPLLVDKVKAILLEMAARIEGEAPEAKADLLRLTHAAVERINALQAEFEDNDSEIETGAREAIAEEFEFIVRAYGFTDLDIEEVIEPRDW